MSDFKAKMHQNRFRLGLRPHPAGEAYSAPPDSLAVFKGAYFYGEGGARGREEVNRFKRYILSFKRLYSENRCVFHFQSPRHASGEWRLLGMTQCKATRAKSRVRTPRADVMSLLEGLVRSTPSESLGWNVDTSTGFHHFHYSISRPMTSSSWQYIFGPRKPGHQWTSVIFGRLGGNSPKISGQNTHRKRRRSSAVFAVKYLIVLFHEIKGRYTDVSL